jgi:hypothetical protein
MEIERLTSAQTEELLKKDKELSFESFVIPSLMRNGLDVEDPHFLEKIKNNPETN